MFAIIFPTFRYHKLSLTFLPVQKRFLLSSAPCHTDFRSLEKGGSWFGVRFRFRPLPFSPKLLAAAVALALAPGPGPRPRPGPDCGKWS